MAQLHEIDLRFAQLHPPSLFDDLGTPPGGGDAQFRHRVPGISEVDRALNEPPLHGRAAVRGTVVRRLAGHCPPFVCHWDSIRSASGRLRLDLSDPLVATEKWIFDNGEPRGMPREVWDILSGVDRHVSAPTRVRELAEPFCHPDASDLRRRSASYAADINNRGLDFERAAGSTKPSGSFERRWQSTSNARVPCGRYRIVEITSLPSWSWEDDLEEAREQLTMAWQSIGRAYHFTSARILTMRLATAFAAEEPNALFLGQLKQHLTIQPLPDLANVTSHWQAESILRVLTPKLNAEHSGLLRQVVAVLNRERAIESLDAWSCWHEAHACELTRPWPASNAAGRHEL